jgi:hypothetical protein
LGINVWGVVVIDVARVVAWVGNGGVCRVLVRPGRIAAGGVDDAVNRIRPDEIPGVNRRAVVEGVARQTGGIDGFDTAAGDAIGPAAVELRLVDVDALFKFGSRPVCDSWDTGAGGDAVPVVLCGGATTRS